MAIKNHLKGHDGVNLTEEEDNKKEEDSNKNKTKLANKELLYFIVSGFLPFRIVDNFHFQRFLKIIASNYKLPSRNHISNALLEIQFKEVCDIIKNDLAGAISIAATTDIWTSCQNLAYMAVTVHFVNEEWKLISHTISVRNLVGKHDNESLKEALIESFSEWGINDKIIAITVDNGKNIIKAVNGIENIELIRCFGHTMNFDC